jgi:hypothetical protein
MSAGDAILLARVFLGVVMVVLLLPLALVVALVFFALLGSLV